VLITTRLFLLVGVSFSSFFSLSTKFFDTQKTHQMTHQKHWYLPDRINCQSGRNARQNCFSRLLSLFLLFYICNLGFEMPRFTAHYLRFYFLTSKSITL